MGICTGIIFRFERMSIEWATVRKILPDGLPYDGLAVLRSESKKTVTNVIDSDLRLASDGIMRCFRRTLEAKRSWYRTCSQQRWLRMLWTSGLGRNRAHLTLGSTAAIRKELDRQVSERIGNHTTPRVFEQRHLVYFCIFTNPFFRHGPRRDFWRCDERDFLRVIPTKSSLRRSAPHPIGDRISGTRIYVLSTTRRHTRYPQTDQLAPCNGE